MKIVILSLLTSAAATGGFVAHDQLPTLTGPADPPAVAAPAPAQAPAGGWQVIATCDDPQQAPAAPQTARKPAPRTVTVVVPQAAPAAPQTAPEAPKATTQAETPAAPQAASSASGGVNVNTASHAELVALPGIGEATATKIEKARPISSVEAVGQLPGVTAANFAKFQSKITV